MGHDLRGRTRRLLQQQLPPGAPPDFVPPARPQPLPERSRLAQVYSTYAVMPPTARMFARTVNAPAQDDPSTGGSAWNFTVTVRPGYTLVLRAVKVGAHVAQALVGGRQSTFYLWAAPQKLEFLLLLNGSPLPDVANPGNLDNVSFGNMGHPWGVYLVAREGDQVTFRVRSYTVWDHGSDSDLDATFYGDMLPTRGLPGDLDVGHDAPLVRVQPEGPV